MITSTANDKVKYARSLQRRRRRDSERQFLVEGLRLIEDAVRAGCVPALLFYQEEQAEVERVQSLLARLQELGVLCLSANDEVLRSLSETMTPQGIVAVVPHPELPRPESPDLVLVLDRLRDPGNLGSILRTAAAAGVDEVLMTRGTVDPINSKALRAGMGAHFRLPISYGLSWRQVQDRLRGLTVWVADAAGERSHDTVDWHLPSALIVGGEAAGPSEQAVVQAHGRLSIPMQSGMESLNAAAATAVILFEAARQRRTQKRAD